jgi:hypothetical protein
MVGAAYAVDSKYFGEIGAYDEGMTVWGGENLEMSWRVSFCRLLLLIISHSLSLSLTHAHTHTHTHTHTCFSIKPVICSSHSTVLNISL